MISRSMLHCRRLFPHITLKWIMTFFKSGGFNGNIAWTLAVSPYSNSDIAVLFAIQIFSINTQSRKQKSGDEGKMDHWNRMIFMLISYYLTSIQNFSNVDPLPFDCLIIPLCCWRHIYTRLFPLLQFHSLAYHKKHHKISSQTDVGKKSIFNWKIISNNFDGTKLK